MFKFLRVRRRKAQFSLLMEIMNLPGFKLVEERRINNGHELIVSIPPTSNFTEFEKKKDNFEARFKGIVTIEKIRFSNLLKVKVITKDLGKYPFKPIETFPNKLLIAKEFDGKPYFVDLDKEGHILIAGQTGTGKSFVLATILTNLIATCGKYVDIYLSQIMKGEVGLFSECKPVKSTLYNLAEVAATLQKLAKIVDERSKLFTTKGCKNLTHYNQNIKGSKLKRIFCVIEEVSFFMPNEVTDSKETYELKQKCWDAVLTITKAGRSSGVHFLSVTQRSTAANLPSEVKAQMCCITTKQRSGRDSENIIDVPDAKDLQDRECYVWGRNGLRLLKVPYVDEDYKDLNKYVPEIRLPNFAEEEAGVGVERVSYIDMPVEEYQKLIEKKKKVEDPAPAIPEVKEKKTKKINKKGLEAC